jgi:hypothetical protein
MKLEVPTEGVNWTLVTWWVICGRIRAERIGIGSKRPNPWTFAERLQPGRGCRTAEAGEEVTREIIDWFIP